MKKILFVLAGFFFWAQNIQCQNIQFPFMKPDFDNVTIFLNSGRVLVGEVQDFKAPKWFEIKNNGILSGSKSTTDEKESSLNLESKKFKFRENKNDEFRLIPSNSINIINIKDKESNNSYEFKRLEIVKSINGEIKETDVSLFLPLFYKDAINLYGYHLYYGKKYATTIFYLNNPKDDRAISPYDLRLVEIFSAEKKLKERIISSYKFISGNCPDFHKWIEEEYYDEIGKIKKEDKKHYKTYRKEIHKAKKKLNTEEEKIKFEKRKWSEYHMKNFLPAIEKYKEFCE